MSGTTKFIKDDSYEEIAATYQCIQIAHLNEALIENGIADKELRKKICESFIFENSVFNDQFWFEAEGKRWYPLSVFTETPTFPVIEVEQLGEVYLRSDAFEFHEYAHGNIDWYFEEKNEDPNDINVGNE